MFRAGPVRWIALTLVFAYGLPKLAEFEMLRHMISPMLCVLAGDFLGCAVIFMLGFRRTAFGVYLSATAVEWALLRFHILPLKWIMLTADTAPTLALLVIMLYVLSYQRLPIE